MANTKKITREERKTAKRAARKNLKETFLKFSRKQVDELHAKPKGGVKGFLLGTNEEKE